MIATIFQSQKTTGKIPISPTGNKKFQFETKKCSSINEIFFYLTSNFFLNIPLVKNTFNYKRRESLENLFVKTLEYVVVDLDGITKLSDRNICVNWFREQGYKCILAESRNPLNIKGIIEVNDLTPKETKQTLKSIEKYLPCKVDKSVTHYGSYQAPILKNVILYEGGHKKLQKVEAPEVILSNIKIPLNIQDICKNKFKELGFIFHEQKNNAIVCSHPSERKSPKGYSWSPDFPFRMSHWNQDKIIDIWTEVIKTKEYKEFQKEDSKKLVQKIMPDIDFNTNQKFLNSNKQQVKNFLDSYKVLKIQSPMGTAKSNIIDEVIKQSHERELRVLLITNRISLADDISSKYKNIKHYQNSELEGKYQIGDNLVCQVNSLWKYSLKYFDVVIIDETTSLLFQLFNIEHKKKNIITKVFATRNKKVVLADAFLFDELVGLFGNSVLEINNGYRDNVELFMYSQVDKWVETILKSLKNGVITVSSGSIKMLKILELIFEEKGITYYTISAETSKQEKELVYKEFKKKIPKWNVIMYSPSITVGISILADSTEHFHLDRGNSMDVISSIQMIKRNRQATKIHLFLQERQQYMPTSLERIQLDDFTETDDDGDNLGMSDVGKKFAVVYKTFNILENRHKLSFLYLMKYQFNLDNLKNINKITEKIKPFTGKIGKLVKQKEQEKDLELFEKYKQLSPEELSDIEYSLFNKTKEEEKIKYFNKLIKDETLKLKKDKIELLVQEEIKTPGIINCYKNILLNPDIISKNNNYSYSIKDYKSFLKKDIDLKNYGYKKIKNIYRLNETLISIL